MDCKFGMYTCAFRKQKEVCDNCEDANSYEWDEAIKHGGKREGAGRPKKHGEPTTTIAFRVPVSKVEQVKQAVKKLINKKPKP